MAINDKSKMQEIVEQYYTGNFQTLIENMLDDIKWTSHKMSNLQLKNKQEVIEFLENAPKGRFEFENTKFILDNNNVVVEGICRYKNKDGKQVENFYCDIYTFQDNKIQNVSAYFL